MEEVEHLTADECDELAEASLREASVLPSERREDLLKLAERYRALAIMKRMVDRKVN
jgi:hypothetical protein